MMLCFVLFLCVQMRSAKQWNVEKEHAKLLRTPLSYLNVSVNLVGSKLFPTMRTQTSSFFLA